MRTNDLSLASMVLRVQVLGVVGPLVLDHIIEELLDKRDLHL